MNPYCEEKTKISKSDMKFFLESMEIYRRLIWERTEELKEKIERTIEEEVVLQDFLQKHSKILEKMNKYKNFS